MTDNIRIPVIHEHMDDQGTIYVHTSGSVDITPEIARQTVALGSLPALAVPNGSVAVKPGWSAPVESCGIYRASDGTDQCSLTTHQPAGDDAERAINYCLTDADGFWIGGSWEMARAVVAKIRRGEVPGITCSSTVAEDDGYWESRCSDAEDAARSAIAERDKALELLRKVQPLLSRAFVNLDIMRDIERLVGKPE